jgi:coenzyme PQQ synthesis protein D (PqqD)
VGGDILLAPAGRDDFDQLSGTAAVSWSILETPCSLEELLRTLSDVYSIPPESIAAEVGALVTDLSERGLVEELLDGP